MSCLPIFAQETPDASDWRIERLVIPARGIIEGDEVISTDIDIDGDGIQERLVTLKLSRTNGQYGHVWSVFGKSGDRFYSFGAIQFRMDTSRIYIYPEVSTSPKLYCLFGLSGDDQGTAILRHSEIVGGEILEYEDTRVNISEHEQYLDSGIRPNYRRIDAAELASMYDPDDLKGICIERGEPFKRDRVKRPKQTKRALDAKDQNSHHRPDGNSEENFGARAWASFVAGVLITLSVAVGYWIRRRRRA